MPPVNAVKDIFMPALSSTMTEGKIVTWLKNVGDKVQFSALICQDKLGLHSELAGWPDEAIYREQYRLRLLVGC